MVQFGPVFEQIKKGQKTESGKILKYHDSGLPILCFDVEPTEQVLGAQMCAWEQPDEIEIPSIRQRLVAMSERIWNLEANRDFKDFSARLSVTNASLTKLLQG